MKSREHRIREQTGAHEGPIGVKKLCELRNFLTPFLFFRIKESISKLIVYAVPAENISLSKMLNFSRSLHILLKGQAPTNSYRLPECMRAKDTDIAITFLFEDDGLSVPLPSCAHFRHPGSGSD